MQLKNVPWKAQAFACCSEHYALLYSYTFPENTAYRTYNQTTITQYFTENNQYCLTAPDILHL